MCPEDRCILAQQKKPGPITRAVVASGIAQMPMLADQRMAFAGGGNVAEADRL